MDRQVQTRMNDVMRKLINYIKTDGITLDHISTEDGRLKSAEGEKEIIASVKRFALKNKILNLLNQKLGIEETLNCLLTITLNYQ